MWCVSICGEFKGTSAVGRVALLAVDAAGLNWQSGQFAVGGLAEE